MFSLIKNIILLSLFGIAVLVASHYFKINGRTVSDQIKSTVSGVQKISEEITKSDRSDLNKLLKEISE